MVDGSDDDNRAVLPGESLLHRKISQKSIADLFPVVDDNSTGDRIEIPIEHPDLNMMMMTIHEVSSKQSVLVC